MSEITQVIPGLGDPPLSTDPVNFDPRADALYGVALPATITAVNTWAGQANAVATYVNGRAIASDASAIASAASAVESAGSAGESAASAELSADTANFAGEWSALVGSLAVPASVRHNGKIWLLLAFLADVQASEPGETADWAAYRQIAVTDRTSNTILTVADFGIFVRYTSGTFTQTFSPAASLGVGWFAWIKNAGSGDVTLDPDGSEEIDGLTSLVMYPNELRLIMVNAAGDGFDSFVYNGFEKTFDSSGTFVKPSGYKAFDVFVQGAGSGGGSGNRRADTSGGTENVTGGGGGGSGAGLDRRINNTEVTSSVAVTVGAGGAGGAASNTLATPAGSNGGASAFGGMLTALGGGAVTNFKTGAPYSTIDTDGYAKALFVVSASGGDAGSGATGIGGRPSLSGGTGGGAGGGVDTDEDPKSGGFGGARGYASGTPAGITNGASGTNATLDGAGGGGGAGGFGVDGGNGGNGYRGGGGGGSGGSIGGTQSGEGGTGGNGYVSIRGVI